MAVGAKSVADVHSRDLLKMAVVDVVGTRGETAESRPLPPGQDVLVVIGLGSEVGGSSPFADRMEPDDVSVRVEDLGTVGVCARVTFGGDEDVASADVPLGCEDRDLRRRS